MMKLKLVYHLMPVWVWNLVFHSKGRSYAGSVQQQNAEKDTSIWAKTGGGNRRVEKSFTISTEHIIRTIIRGVVEK